MVCPNCRLKSDTDFCPGCGTKLEADTAYNIESYVRPSTKKKSALSSLIQWYLTASFGLSGLSIMSAISAYPTGISWLIGGVLLCPKLFTNISTKKKGLAALVLFFIGVFLAP